MEKGAKKHTVESRKSFFINTIAKFCDKCGLPYSPTDLEILQDSGSSSIIHFSCPACKSEHIATFVKSMGIASRININTDLEGNEISKFAMLENTSTDEILEIYSSLKKNQEVKL
jgi:hypothetical protein